MISHSGCKSRSPTHDKRSSPATEAQAFRYSKVPTKKDISKAINPPMRIKSIEQLCVMADWNDYLGTLHMLVELLKDLLCF